MSKTDLTFSIRETAICPSCHLHQYLTFPTQSECLEFVVGDSKWLAAAAALRARRMVSGSDGITKVEGGHFRNLAILLQAAAALDLEIDQVFVRVRDRRSRQVSASDSDAGS